MYTAVVVAGFDVGVNCCVLLAVFWIVLEDLVLGLLDSPSPCTGLLRLVPA